MTFRRALPRLALALLMTCAIALTLLNRQALDTVDIEAWLDALGIWSPIAFLGLWVVWAVLFLPGAILGITGGALFGPMWGTLLTLVGATVGATLAFLIGRYLASDWAARKAGGRLKYLLDGVNAEGWRFVAFMRLVPLFPFNLLNYVLGATGIRLSAYVLTTFICMVPGTIAYTYLGYIGREALVGGEDLLQKGLMALGLLAAVAILPRLVSAIKGSAGQKWIEPDELISGHFTIIDVRAAEEFSGPLGHVPGSRSIPLHEIESHIEELIALRGQRLALICKTDKRSAKGADLLRRRGVRNVSVVRGGIERWNASIATAGSSGS